MRALIREVAPCFADALCAVPPDPPIDLAEARRQHEAYMDALGHLDIDNIIDLSNHEFADGCFVEDTAVIANRLALVTRPGATSRQGESRLVELALGSLEPPDDLEVVRMEAPATLDGGDCMRVGTTIFVGRSARTNAAGIARLAEVFEPRGYRVVPIDMPAGVLHLKCVCAPLGEDRITLADGSIPPAAFGEVHVVRVPAEESYAANVLALGDRVLVADGFPRTREALERAGFHTRSVMTTEFRKADGALTCLSIVF